MKLRLLQSINDLMGNIVDEEKEYKIITFAPDTNSLNKEEHDRLLDDIGGERYGFIEFFSFVSDMTKSKNKEESDLYKRILSKLYKYNKNKLEFIADQQDFVKKDIRDFNNDPEIAMKYIVDFFEKWDKVIPGIIEREPENEDLYDYVKKYKEQNLNESKRVLFIKLLLKK